MSGSASHLQRLHSGDISFPELPTFFCQLVISSPSDWRTNGYITPEAMVTGLAALTRRRTLSITFISPPNQRRRRPDPQMWDILPALTQFHYKCYSEYSEDLLVLIDTPLVDNVCIKYFIQEVSDRSSSLLSCSPTCVISPPTGTMWNRVDAAIWTTPNGCDSSTYFLLWKYCVFLTDYIASALSDTTEEMVIEILPVLYLLWLDEDNEECGEPMGPTE